VTPAGAKLDRFLGEAIGELQPATTETSETPMSAGMRRLTGLTESLVREMDAKAGALADRLQKARDRSSEALGKFDAYVGSVEAAAQEAEDTINQLTNGAPPLDSDGSAPKPD
jgi:hypothetical protein